MVFYTTLKSRIHILRFSNEHQISLTIISNMLCYVVFGQHGGAVASSVASWQEGPGFLNLLGHFCIKFACSPNGWMLHFYNWTNLNVILLFHMVKKVIKSVAKSSQSVRIFKVSSWVPSQPENFNTKLLRFVFSLDFYSVWQHCISISGRVVYFMWEELHVSLLDAVVCSVFLFLWHSSMQAVLTPNIRSSTDSARTSVGLLSGNTLQNIVHHLPLMANPLIAATVRVSLEQRTD